MSIRSRLALVCGCWLVVSACSQDAAEAPKCFDGQGNAIACAASSGGGDASGRALGADGGALADGSVASADAVVPDAALFDAPGAQDVAPKVDDVPAILKDFLGASDIGGYDGTLSWDLPPGIVVDIGGQAPAACHDIVACAAKQCGGQASSLTCFDACSQGASGEVAARYLVYHDCMANKCAPKCPAGSPQACLGTCIAQQCLSEYFVCGTDGAIGKLACSQVMSCFQACPQSGAGPCLSDCLGSGTLVAQAQAEGLLECSYQQGAGFQGCSEAYAACYCAEVPPSGSGKTGCGGLVDCVQQCGGPMGGGQDPCCESKCLAKASKAAIEAGTTLQACVDSCGCPPGGPGSMKCRQKCLGSTCKAELDACIDS